MSKEFWCVWREFSVRPIVKHDSERSARLEAERLAKNHPDTPFYVLKAVGVATNRTVVFEKIGNDHGCAASDDEIAF